MRIHRPLAATAALVLLAGCNIGSSTPSALRDTPPAPTTAPIVNTTSAPVPTATSAPATTSSAAVLAPPPKPLTVPQGFTASVYAENVGTPRGLGIDAQGRAYVVDRSGSRIVRLKPEADAQGLHGFDVAVEGLKAPHSVAFHDNFMYVGETNQISRFPANGDGWGAKEVVVPNLPTGGHNTRTVVFGNDGKMYVSVGSSCNVCNEDEPHRAAIWQYDPDGKNGKLYTKGLRNAVGVVLRPGTSELWASNNGRDNLGDDLPPETVNVLADGADFGWPRCHASRIVDPEFGQPGSCDGVKAPAVEMQAHSAPLGLAFYAGTQFPADYQGSLFVAFHGSWNRSEPTGYKVVRVPVDANGKAGPVQDFATGWQAGSDVWGRPVDLLVLPDGSLLISDDEGGRIFRISYQG